MVLSMLLGFRSQKPSPLFLHHSPVTSIPRDIHGDSGGEGYADPLLLLGHAARAPSRICGLGQPFAGCPSASGDAGSASHSGSASRRESQLSGGDEVHCGGGTGGGGMGGEAIDRGLVGDAAPGGAAWAGGGGGAFVGQVGGLIDDALARGTPGVVHLRELWGLFDNPDVWLVRGWCGKSFSFFHSYSYCMMRRWFPRQRQPPCSSERLERTPLTTSPSLAPLHEEPLSPHPICFKPLGVDPHHLPPPRPVSEHAALWRTLWARAP